ncbi:SDR family oxidoreductase [Dickeya zeae]|uniref:SDR family oxidoreductase n=1 Tax=Dickeya zeae TaxID=204042 RepID=UPI0008FBD60C|nr:SDR family oxidoreductase [Dickeya zeae]
MSTRSLFLVSGGTGGIGSAICKELASRGYTPIIGYRSNSLSAQNLAMQVGGLAVHLDLSSDESIEAATKFILEQNSPLAGVILAGSPPPDLVPFGKIQPTVLQEHIRVNVIGPQYLLSLLVRNFFRKQKQGTVVGILTQAMGQGIGTAMSGMGAYTIGKYGLLGILSVLSADYPWLRVKTVSPGYTETPMLNAFDERFLDMQRANVQFSTPIEVAHRIVDEAISNEP